MKAHYPLEFFTAILHFESDAEKIKEYKSDAKRHDIVVNPLDLNKSKVKFDIVDNQIYFGFSNVKGIGEEAAARIVAAQPYASFNDFLTRFGTDESVIKPLIGLRMFKEGRPEKVYVYYKWYKKVRDNIEARKKRYTTKWSEYNVKLSELMGREINNPDEITEEELDKLEAEIGEGSGGVEGMETAEERRLMEVLLIKELYNKYEKSIETFKKKAAVEEVLPYDKFILLPDEEMPPVDEKLMALYPDQMACEKQYYGFVWHHPLGKSPDYEGGRTFDSLRDRGLDSDYVEVLLHSVTKQQSKKNKAVTYWLLKAEDENGEELQIQVWEDDWERFKDDLKAGELVKLELKKPDSGFGRYTLYGPPKWKRYLLPKSREHDLRVVVLRKE